MATRGQIERADSHRSQRVSHTLCIVGRGWGTYCQCMCPYCWEDTGIVRRMGTNLGIKVGRCVCYACPCREEQ